MAVPPRSLHILTAADGARSVEALAAAPPSESAGASMDDNATALHVDRQKLKRLSALIVERRGMSLNAVRKPAEAAADCEDTDGT